MNLELLSTIRSNGSARSFTDEPVDDATVYRILDTARFAPSGGNRQGWGVILVKDPARRAEVGRLCQPGWREYVALRAAGYVPFAARDGGDKWPGAPAEVDLTAARERPVPFPLGDDLATVPAVLVITADLQEIAAFDAELDRLGIIGGASIYPFCQNVLLAARAEGLAGVLTTFLAREEPAARALLGLPGHVAIAALIALGRPVHQPTKLTRRPVEAFTVIDGWGGAPLQPA
ncbi:MAG: nitroreductase family protein [Acidimicrobiales bacterium]